MDVVLTNIVDVDEHVKTNIYHNAESKLLKDYE